MYADSASYKWHVSLRESVLVLCPMYELGVDISSLLLEMQSPNWQKNWCTTKFQHNGVYWDVLLLATIRFTVINFFYWIWWIFIAIGRRYISLYNIFTDSLCLLNALSYIGVPLSSLNWLLAKNSWSVSVKQ